LAASHSCTLAGCKAHLMRQGGRLACSPSALAVAAPVWAPREGVFLSPEVVGPQGATHFEEGASHLGGSIQWHGRKKS